MANFFQYFTMKSVHFHFKFDKTAVNRQLEKSRDRLEHFCASRQFTLEAFIGLPESYTTVLMNLVSARTALFRR